MAEEVEIINVGNGGVASEETLVALLEVMKKLAKSKGFDPDEATKQIKDLAESTENLVDVVEDHTKALEENTEEVKNNSSALGGAARWITSAFTQAGTSAIMLGTELVVGGERLSDFSQHIPFVGSLLTELTSRLDTMVDQFRSMTNVGVDFGESLIELRRTAAESGLSFDTFSTIIKDNSENLALFGGSARAGARIFTDVSRIVQRDFGPQFSALGMTMEQTAEFTADYLDIQRRLGNTERYNQTQLAFGTNNYIMMLDRLSKITGKQRDQIADELEAQRSDVVFASFLSSLGPEISENVQEAVSITPDIIKNGIRDLFSFGGNIATKEASDVAAAIGMVGGNFGELQNIIQGISSGLRDESDLAEYINTLKSGIDETNRMTLQASAKGGNAAAETALAFGQMGEVATNISEVSEEQRKAMERGNQGLLDFERRITQLRNEIVGKLIDSGIFQRLETAASGFVDMLTGPKGSAALKNAIDSIAGFLEEFMADIQTVGLWNAIKDNLLTGLSSIWEEIKLQLFGGTRDNTDKIKSTESRIKSLQTERQTLGEKARKGVGEVTPEQIKTIDAAIQQLEAERDKLAQEHGKQIEGVLSGVSDSLLGISEKQINDLKSQRASALEEIAGLEARDRKGVISEEDTVRLAELRSEVAAINEELANSEGMLSGVGESLFGMTEKQINDLKDKQMSALAEISAYEVKEQTGTISEQETVRLAKLRTEVAALDEELANSQGMFGPILDNLGGIAGLLAGGLLAGGIVAIGAALLAATPGALGFGAAIGMAAGGVGYALHGVSSIMEAMAENTRATTEQIEKLANIPDENLLNAAVGIERMKEALDGFTPSNWEGFVDWALGGAKKDSMEATTNVIMQLAETFSNINPEVIKSASTAIVSMSSALNTFNEATSIQGVGDLASRLLGYQESATAITTLATSLQGINGSNLENVAPGIIALSLALNTFNEATSIQGVGDLATRLLGYQDSATAITTLATSLQGIDGSSLENVAPGIVAVSQAVSQFQKLTAIDSISDAVSAALQSYIPLSSTVADVATRLASIERPESLTSISSAVLELIVAIGQFQQLTAIDSISDAVSAALQSYIPLSSTVADVATRLASIQTPENLSIISPAITDLAIALGEFQQLTAIDSIGDAVSAALQSYIPLSNTVADVATRLSSIENPERLSAVSPAITDLAIALGQFQQLTAIDSISESISVALGSYSAATTPLIDLINSLSLIDGSTLKNAGPGIEAVSNALTVFKNSTGFQGIGDLVANWFSEDAMEIGTKIQTIANDLNQIDSSRLTSVSGSIVLMGNALQSFSNIKLEDISINNDFVEKLQTLSTLSTGLSSTATSLNEIASVNGVRDNLDAINQGLDASAVNTYASAIEKLVENLNDLNEVLSDSNDTFLKNNLSAAEVLGNITVTNQGNAEAVEELNIVMTEILSTLRQSNEYERRIERNTASLGSDITSGRVSTIR